MQNKAKLLVAGGGTGGHILAGVAIADQWKAQHPQADILFVGAFGGIEEKLVPKNGYPLELVSLGSLNRVSLKKKLRTSIQLPLALIKSMVILLRFRPQSVIGVGGYASGPVVLMAEGLRLLGILRCTTAILEQNSIPGFTNRILGKVVQRVFCSFPGTEKLFPPSRAQITGNPIRSSLKRMPSASRSPFTLFIFGGSQGAIGINTLMLEALPHLSEITQNIRIIHQTGEKDFERIKEGYTKLGFPARVEKFVYEMPEAYAQSSLLICRSGSSTLSEIASVGRAAVLIPFPFASDDHQQRNAEVFAGPQNDAFVLRQLGEHAATGKDLAQIILELYRNPSKISQMEEAVTRFHRPAAAQDIVHELSKGI